MELAAKISIAINAILISIFVLWIGIKAIDQTDEQDRPERYSELYRGSPPTGDYSALPQRCQEKNLRTEFIHTTNILRGYERQGREIKELIEILTLTYTKLIGKNGTVLMAGKIHSLKDWNKNDTQALWDYIKVYEEIISSLNNMSLYEEKVAKTGTRVSSASQINKLKGKFRLVKIRLQKTRKLIFPCENKTQYDGDQKTDFVVSFNDPHYIALEKEGKITTEERCLSFLEQLIKLDTVSREDWVHRKKCRYGYV